MPDRRTAESARALLLGAAVPVLAVVVVLVAVAVVVVAALQMPGAGVLGWLLAALLGPATWQLLTGRSTLPVSPPGAKLGAGALTKLVAGECRTLGVPGPGELRVGPGRDIGVHRQGDTRVLLVGLAALAELDPGQLRLAVADALALDADAERGRLIRMRHGLIDRALWIGTEHRISSTPWRWLAQRAARELDAALARRTALVAGRLARRDRDLRFQGYWAGAVVPCLEEGFRPPIAAGWRRHLPEATGSSLELSAEPLDALEARALAAVDPGRARELVPIAWDRVGEAVVLPSYRRLVAGKAWLADYQLGDVGEAAAVSAKHPGTLDVLAGGVLVALADAGWSVELELPTNVRIGGEEASVEPFGLVYGLAYEEFDPAGWRRFTEELGLDELPLAPPPGEASAPGLEALAVAPHRGSLELTLRGSRRLRRRTAAVVAPMVLLALPVSLACIAAAAGDATLDMTVRLVLVGMGVALATGIGWWARLRWRLAFTRGRLLIDEQRVRIEHEGLLRHPYELPRSYVRAAVGDPRGDRDPLGRPVRFAFAGTPWDDRDGRPAGWLWVAGYPAIAPFLGVEADVPNLLLVFERPGAGPVARHGVGHAPLPQEAVGGLMLAVEAPGDLASALAAVGFPAALTRDDLHVLVRALEGELAPAR